MWFGFPLKDSLFANVILLFQKLFFRYFVKKEFLWMFSSDLFFLLFKCAKGMKIRFVFSISSISLCVIS